MLNHPNKSLALLLGGLYPSCFPDPQNRSRKRQILMKSFKYHSKTLGTPKIAKLFSNDG